MTKGEVIKKVGSPTVVRGAIKNKYGETVEVWEYNLSVPPTNDQWVWSAATFGFGLPFALSQQEPYWLYFVNEKLVRWGKAGDWKREADHIYEIRFGSDQGVATQ